MATKLIIADDEPLVLVGLQSMLDWGKLDIEIVAVVRNGKMLEEAIEQHVPDLVITDIKMPLKTGLEVQKECSEKYGRLPLFILLTSYDVFSFGKEALSYQAVDYFVKLELTEEKLQASVSKALKLLAQLKGSEENHFPLLERSAMQGFRDKFFVRLFNGLIDSRQAFEKQKRELQLSLYDAWHVVCYVEIKTEQERAEVNLYTSTLGMLNQTLSRYLTCYFTSLDLHHLAITFCLTNEQHAHYRTIIRQVLEKTLQVIYNYFSVNLVCSVGLAVQDPFFLHTSFLSARQLITSQPGNQAILFAQQWEEGENTFSLDF